MKKHSVLLSGHATSISLEPIFWQALQQIATDQNTSVRQLITRIDNTREGNLSSAIRVFVVESFIKNKQK